MTRRSRAAALGALVITPTLASLAIAFCATLGPARTIPSGPLEPGEKIGRTRAWLESSGFYPAELDGAHSFSWMRAAGRIRLAHLERSGAYTLSLWLQPAVVTRPVQLITAVDGIVREPVPLHPGLQQIDIDIPAAESDRAIVDLTVSETFIPGAADRRTLGLRVDDVALAAADGRLPIPANAVRAIVALSVAIGITVAMTLNVRPLAFAVGAGAGSWMGFLASFDAAFLGDYPSHLLPLGGAVAIAGAAGRLATLRYERDDYSLRPLLGVLIVLTACQMALFLHPMVAVGDSIFHVHRAQVVQRGEYFFTSITPKPYFEFPYPPGLYVVVGPLWNAFRGDTAHVWLLRSATLIAESALAVAVYWLLLARWRNHLTAFVSALITILLPVGFYTICTSNLTNSFAQSMFGIGLAILLAGTTETRARWMLQAAGGAFICAGFLSHFSTFSVGIPLLAACAAVLWLRGPGAPRRLAMTLAIVLAVTAGVAVAVYYARFVPVYKQTIERVLAKEDPGSRSMVAPVSTKATRILSTIPGEFGTVALIAAFAGMALLLHGRATDPVAPAMAAWCAVTAGFWVLAILTAIEMRASLAAQPLIGMLAGTAIARGVERRGAVRIAALLALASIALRAISDWAGCLGIAGFWRL